MGSDLATAAQRRLCPGGPRPFMALIVPAHDEEAVIGDTLETLVRLDSSATPSWS